MASLNNDDGKSVCVYMYEQLMNAGLGLKDYQAAGIVCNSYYECGWIPWKGCIDSNGVWAGGLFGFNMQGAGKEFLNYCGVPYNNTSGPTQQHNGKKYSCPVGAAKQVEFIIDQCRNKKTCLHVQYRKKWYSKAVLETSTFEEATTAWAASYEGCGNWKTRYNDKGHTIQVLAAAGHNISGVTGNVPVTTQNTGDDGASTTTSSGTSTNTDGTTTSADGTTTQYLGTKLDLSSVKQEEASYEIPDVVNGTLPYENDSAYTPKIKDEKTHTRIYQYMASEIVLDELSIPIDTYDTASSTGSLETQNGVSSVLPENQRSGQEFIKDKGTTYPIIRINDHILHQDEINRFEISTVSFVPTMTLVYSSSSSDFQKNNLIKEGDICSTFVSNGNGMIKSLRNDWLITSVNTTTYNYSQQTQNVHSLNISGELYVPALHNDNITYALKGTSRDALIDICKKVKIGFNFNETDNTNDKQVYYCCIPAHDDNDIRHTKSTPAEFMENLVKAAYKDANSFYAGWIDPRYALTFINVNKQLGANELDEEIDLAPYTQAFTKPRTNDGHRIVKSDEELKSLSGPQLKLLSNTMDDSENVTSFHVMTYHLINQAKMITNEMGAESNKLFSLHNSGFIANSEQTTEGADIIDFSMSYNLLVNQTKLDTKQFYWLIGDGTPTTYAAADNGSYVSQNTKKDGGDVTNVMSDGDDSGQDNEQQSGNVNKNSIIGMTHNLRNNKQLQKQYLTVDLEGCNLEIMRGEKIPVLLADLDGYTKFLGEHPSSQLNLTDYVYETLSGWYIIDTITWKWVRERENKSSQYTNWTTTVKLVRREWPIPGSAGTFGGNSDNSDVVTTITGTGTSKLSVSDKNKTVVNDGINTLPTNDTSTANATTDTKNDDSQASANNVNSATVADGLNQKLSNIYNNIAVNAFNDGITLTAIVSKLWRCDSDGKKVNGVDEQGIEGSKKMYIDGYGRIYYGITNDDHLDGNAIDFIADSQDHAKKLIQSICGNDDLVQEMAKYNVGLCFNNGFSPKYNTGLTCKDDSYNSDRMFHLGTMTNVVTTWQKYVKAQKNTAAK